jgi:hypothetical protein
MARIVALGFLFMLLAAGLFSTCAGQEPEEGAPADSLSETDAQDEEPMDLDEEEPVGEGDEEEPVGEELGEEEVPAERIPMSYDHWYNASHPTVEFTLAKDKDVTNWNTLISMVQPFSNKFSVRLNATLHNRTNTTLERADADDATTAAMRYDLSDDISFAVNYNSTVLANWYDLNGGSPDDRKKRGSFTVSSDVATTVGDAVQVSGHVGGGATQNSYSNVSNSGNQGDIAASVTYMTPDSDFRASGNYTAKQLFLTSQLDSSGTVVLETKDQTFSQNLNFDTGFSLFPGLRVTANILANDEQKQRPDQVAQEQETELRKRRAVSMATSFRGVERFTWDASVSLSRAKSRFLIRNDRNSDVNTAVIDGSVKITPWNGSSLSMGGKWSDIRSVYITADTGNNIQKSLSLKYAQKMGPKADLSFSALSDLAVVAYDNKAENPKDRDMLSNRFRLDIGYKPRQRISLSIGGEVSSEKSVYTQSKQSGNNKNTERYRVTGSYDVKTWKNISINQRYEISSVFTEYDYDDARNTLVRNSNISTAIDFRVVSNLGFNVRHTYRFQDQGGYRREGGVRYYALASESESQTMTLAMSYRLGRFINIRIRQGFFTDTRWKYVDGARVVDYTVRNTDLSGKVGFNYKISDASEIAFSIEHNRKEGDRVAAAFRSYWNAEIKAKHIF